MFAEERLDNNLKINGSNMHVIDIKFEIEVKEIKSLLDQINKNKLQFLMKYFVEM